MQAHTQNGAPRFERGVLETQLDAIKDEVIKLLEHAADRVTARVEHRSRLRTISHRATDTIKAHPIATVTAAAAALAIGYLAIQIARR